MSEFNPFEGDDGALNGGGPGEDGGSVAGRDASGQSAGQATRQSAGSPPLSGELPSDIEAIWGGSALDRRTAGMLIKRWGLDRFRASQLHVLAVADAERTGDRSDFKPEKKAKR